MMATKALIEAFWQRPCPVMCMFLFSVFKDSVAYEPRVSLYLDPQIRDWVLFPITLVMVTCRVCCHIHQFSSSLQHQILVGILRHYVVLLLQSTPKSQSRAAIREQCVPYITDFDVQTETTVLY